MSANSGILQPDTLFRHRYRVLRVIKSGGMGAVYEVLDEATATRRALKVMLPSLLDSEELRARFALEARITGSIESDHIVRTSDAGVDEQTGTPFLVMELLRGEELGSLVKKRGSLPPAEVSIYLFQASMALDRTHAASIIHRDLKPDNLFVTVRDDGSPCVKILDFGIAKVLEQHHASTLTRQMIGTPIYMSPEQIRAEKNITSRADIHALGHVAYTLLVGESYWAEEAEAIPSPYLLAAELLRGPLESPSIRARRRRSIPLPLEFDAWFIQATAVRADERFDRASTAIVAMAEALGVALPKVARVVLLPELPPGFSGPSPTDATLPSHAGTPARFADVITVTAPELLTKGAASARAGAPAPTSAPTSSRTPAPPASSRAPSHPTSSKTPAQPASGKTPAQPASGKTPTQPVSGTASTQPSGKTSAQPASGPTPTQRGPDTWARPSSTASGSASTTSPSRTSSLSGAEPPRSLSSRRDRGQRRFEVRADLTTGIVYVKVWGFWDVEEGKAYFEEFRQKAATVLGKPWYVLADIADFAAQKPEVSAFVGSTMAYASQNGMKKAANLVSSALTKMQISRLSADMSLPEFSFFTAEKDAVAWLLKDG